MNNFIYEWQYNKPIGYFQKNHQNIPSDIILMRSYDKFDKNVSTYVNNFDIIKKQNFNQFINLKASHQYMKKSPIKVIIRLRPTSNYAHKNMQVDEQTGQINIHVDRALDQGIINHQQNQWGFKFEKVLTNASQDVVFNLGAKEILTSALEGYSGCVLCYGQTGAGKTFTMTGAQSDYKYRGVIPRVLSALYQQINSRYQHQIKVSISYLELYNESLSDLLDDSNTNPMSIQEDSKGYVIVKGLSLKQADNQEAALEMLFEGQNNRTIAEHKLNKNSSRSHCIFTIHLEIRSRVESSEKVVMSKINLVDLAGSERTKKTGSEGKTLVQAQFINKSLSFLQQVVVALSQSKRDHIPYRQNKLTYLLKDSIGGNSKTCMIANVWPEQSHLEQTISTLKFAGRMMKVSNQISVQMNLDPKLLLKKYEKDIRELKQELAMHDTLASRGRINYEPYAPEQQHQQQLLAKKYLDGEIEDIQVQSLRQVRELFIQFKNIYKSAIKDVENNSFIKKDQESKQKVEDRAQPKDLTGKVGVEESTFGFGAGKAVKDAKPSKNISNLVNIPKDQFEDEESQAKRSPKKQIIPQRKIVNVDKNQAYQEFKSTVGLQVNNSILKNIEQLKTKKDEIKRKTEQAQKMKDKITQLDTNLKAKQQGKTQQELSKNIIDEQEFEMMKEKKIYKRDYKLQIQKIKQLRHDIIELDKNVTSLKTTMIQKFEAWFFKRHGITVADLDNPLLNQNQNADEEQKANEAARPEDVDEDALAYIQAKKRVNQLQRARKGLKP